MSQLFMATSQELEMNGTNVIFILAITRTSTIREKTFNGVIVTYQQLCNR